MNAPPQPFFDLAACIEAAEKAAISARSIALDNPEQAERHEARAIWLETRVQQWEAEMAPMNKDTVLAYANLLAEANLVVEQLGAMNRSLDVTKRVEQEAEYRIAKDRCQSAQEKYRWAFDQWASEGYPE